MAAPEGLSPGEATDVVQFELVHDTTAPGRARRVTRDALLGWRLPDLVDAVVLVVSELVTNAVRHGRPPLSMELRRRAEQVRLAVHDGNPAKLVPADAAADAESGRGMSIVDVLADDVLVEQVTGGGKIIHAAFGIGVGPSDA